MSKKTQESTFLSQMEPSTISKEVVKLGEKLVHELKLESSNNTLGCWMAHHLAELLEKERMALGDEETTTSRECADLILKLWGQRDHLPVKHRPLESFESILQAIDRLRSSETFYFQRYANQVEEEVTEEVENWLLIAEKIDEIARELVYLCINNAIRNATDQEKSWLEVGLGEKIPRDTYAEIIAKITGLNDHVAGKEEKFADQLESFANFCMDFANEIKTREMGTGNGDRPQITTRY